MNNTTVVTGLSDEHRFQVPKTGWCAQAQLQMLHIASGQKDISQAEIANTIMKDGKPLYDPKWGTSHERLVEYLKERWTIAGSKSNATWQEIQELLDKGYYVIANVMGLDVEEGAKVDKGGHYVRIKKYDKEKNLVEVYDSSNGVRPDGKKGIYTLRADYDPKDKPKSPENRYNFSDYFWDYANPKDEKNKVRTERWIAYADPLSIKSSLAPAA